MAKNDDKTVEAEVEEGNGIVATFDVSGAIQSLNDVDTGYYSSIKGDAFAAKKKIAAALTSSDPIADNLNKDIDLVDVIVQKVQIADENTGEVSDAPRVTLVAKGGDAYHGTSIGLMNSVRQLFSIVGEPDGWDEAVQIRVVEKRGRRGWRYQTIELV